MWWSMRSVSVSPCPSLNFEIISEGRWFLIYTDYPLKNRGLEFTTFTQGQDDYIKSLLDVQRCIIGISKTILISFTDDSELVEVRNQKTNINSSEELCHSVKITVLSNRFLLCKTIS